MIPHLLYDLRPGTYAATTAAEVYRYEPATAAGTFSFIGPDSGSLRVQMVETSSVPTVNESSTLPKRKSSTWLARLWRAITAWLRGKHG